ncbi:hypothetical protein [Boseongicola aestuarii]|uniref:Uncharacterized protein n=1 Tax=Boseongicola aestuarii TaxID=1470561 RepID=A0A238J6D3_9RHOB|nr:hypothetical protein [Boseongicola aestuarii]SMX25705.1 hypothetical protein BOA8489_03849 [Boseongicola aestuarii]
MLSRTTTPIVAFVHPFLGAGYKEELPPGNYGLSNDDGVLQSHSFTAYRRPATHRLSAWAVDVSGLRPIDHNNCAMALVQDQIDPTNNKNGEAALSPSKD